MLDHIFRAWSQAHEFQENAWFKCQNIQSQMTGWALPSEQPLPCGTKRTLFITFLRGPALMPCSPANSPSCCINLSVWSVTHTETEGHRNACIHLHRHTKGQAVLSLASVIKANHKVLSNSSPPSAPGETGTEFQSDEEIAAQKENTECTISIALHSYIFVLNLKLLAFIHVFGLLLWGYIIRTSLIQEI